VTAFVNSPRWTGRFTWMAVATSCALALTACGGAKVGSTGTGAVTSAAAATSAAAPTDGASPSGASAASATGGAATAACGTVNLGVNPWVGYESDAAVVTYLLTTKLGCKVVAKNLDETVVWDGFATGQVDAILEVWGHPNEKKKYVDDQKVAEVIGSTGRKGKIGWYVVPWMAKQYPDITDWQNLNKYADLFKTSESGGKGQFLDGDPGFVTADGGLIKNLKLNFKVVYGGSETALITTFRQAEKDHKPAIGYWYSPQWFNNEVPMVNIKLPTYDASCHDDSHPADAKCDYPDYDLYKVASVKFASSGSPAYDFIKKFQWTNEDQNTVSKYIAIDKLSDEAAAKKWVDANPDKVKAWLPAS